jgi:uncharacterized protein (TIGR00251 family)
LDRALERTTPFLQSGDKIRIVLRLTPNSSNDEIFGIEQGPSGPHFKARTRAQPEKGKANTALIKLVAKWLHIAKSEISLKSGSKSRIKTVEISAPSEETIALLQKQLENLS